MGISGKSAGFPKSEWLYLKICRIETFSKSERFYIWIQWTSVGYSKSERFYWECLRKFDGLNKCKLNIARSTEPPECAVALDNGGYTVHPVPTPASVNIDANSNKSDGGNNQKLILFILGNAMSGAPIIKGTNQFPKPPISVGITIKKIINIA